MGEVIITGHHLGYQMSILNYNYPHACITVLFSGQLTNSPYCSPVRATTHNQHGELLSKPLLCPIV